MADNPADPVEGIVTQKPQAIETDDGVFYPDGTEYDGENHHPWTAPSFPAPW